MSKITAEHLARRACVYIRQSTPDQVQNNLESQRRQYALVDRARQLGWQEVEVIDEDLGRSGSGTLRPGFERLLGSLCDGKVGAVLSIEASRLARNGRDWHTLLEFCSVVGALLIDADGVYDPAQTNDRLLLGMKGTISEMELNSFRQRAQGAIEQKAKRGELFRRVPIGYVRGPDDRIEKDANERVRTAIDLLFRKFVEFASVRRLYFWLCEEKIKLPTICGAGSARQLVWKDPRYHSLLSLLRNPAYAGAYAYGRSKSTVRIEQGRKRIARTKQKNQEDWTVLIIDHHEGYIDWGAYQTNQALIAQNANAKGAAVQGSVKCGSALLTGLMRCGHCGAKLIVQYPSPTSIRYQCSGRILDRDLACCIMFSGTSAHRVVVDQVLQCLRPLGLEAALQAIENSQGVENELLHQKQLELEQARYEVGRAQRQYDAVDPANRLVAGALEKRWNDAMKEQSLIEDEVTQLAREAPSSMSVSAKEDLLALATDLPSLWEHPASPHEFKKRILRTILKEIIATSEGDAVRLVLHWRGGDHTELQFNKTPTGGHRFVTNVETINLIKFLARLQPDGRIAATINRLGQRTAHDETWTATRICSIRNHHNIAVYRDGERQERGDLTIDEVATMLGVNPTTVLRLIRLKHLTAQQACRNSPWVVHKGDVERYVAASIKPSSPQAGNSNQMALDIQ